MELRSQSFAEGEPVPKVHTCDGEDRSPPLAWSGAPAGTRSYALIVVDPDAPGGTFSHWGLFDIPAAASELQEGYAAASTAPEPKEATNDFQRIGWGGPCPPPGHGVHRYHFRLLALDVEQLDLPRGAHCRDIERAANPHVIARAQLTGTYER